MAQGKCAAFGMAGQPEKLPSSVAMHSTVQLRDIQFISMGMLNPVGEGYEIIMEHNKGNNTYKKLIIKGNLLKGLVLIRDTGAANTLSGILRKEIDITPYMELFKSSK
jgi:NAD(P)H-nitrite reductase large subunit